MLKRYLLMAAVLLIGLPGLLSADDTSIYGTTAVTGIKPNVLIIFDTSGSMTTADIPSNPYDSAVTYTGSYDSDGWYYRKKVWWRWKWYYGGPMSDWACSTIADAFKTSGEYRDSWCEDTPLNTCAESCSSTGSIRNYDLKTGNFRNYEESGAAGDKMQRTQAAKDVVNLIIDANADKVNFGLMRLDGYSSEPDVEGGELIIGCDPNNTKAELIEKINSMPASGGTPLAEALAEAGLYFAGKTTWYDQANGKPYSSPISEPCQKNYIILMTDGEPTSDGSQITSAAYINGDIIGDYDNSGGENSNSYLDDVALYLNTRDCNPVIGNGTSYEDQYLTVHTIGFSTGAAGASDLLQSTADNGGGTFYHADSTTGLANAFSAFISEILEESTTFVAPVVPVNRTNRTSSSEWIYLAFFKPVSASPWIGNIKKFMIGNGQVVNGKILEKGTIYDSAYRPAIKPDGTIQENSMDFWAESQMGDAVDKGGVGEVLLGVTRKLYTHLGPSMYLKHVDNEFTTANEDLKAAPHLLTNDVINTVYKSGETWRMGDIIHSEPVVAHYGNKSVVYAGSNGGILHCFDDDTGAELWGFIPPDQLGRLYLLQKNYNSYFVDGSLGLTYHPIDPANPSDELAPHLLMMGERRGGTNYHVLDVTDSTNPQYKYPIAYDYLDPDKDDPNNVYEPLGQSWSRIKTGKVISNGIKKDVFVLAGGYDNDQDTGWQSVDDSGRAVIMVEQDTGTYIGGVDNGSWSDMKRCVVDVNAFAYNADDIISRIYFGDMGGDVFVMADDIDFEVSPKGCTTNPNVPCITTPFYKKPGGSWPVKLKLFSASDVAADSKRKIMYAPVSGKTQKYNDELVFFGTGNRADPSSKTVINRFYCVKNDWSQSDMSEAQLVDVTGLTQDGTNKEHPIPAEASNSLYSKRGWFFDLNFAMQGEKVVSAPLIYGEIVIFSTYTPPPEDGAAAVLEACESKAARGQGRLYIINMFDGTAVIDADGNEKKEPKERYINLRDPMASPMIDGDTLRAGTESWQLGTRTIMDHYFWRQN